MPTTLRKGPVHFVECCGIAVPIATNHSDERDAYNELALGGLIVIAIALPVAATMFWLL
jgi:hypothetical protein